MPVKKRRPKVIVLRIWRVPPAKVMKVKFKPLSNEEAFRDSTEET